MKDVEKRCSYTVNGNSACIWCLVDVYLHQQEKEYIKTSFSGFNK